MYLTQTLAFELRQWSSVSDEKRHRSGQIGGGEDRLESGMLELGLGSLGSPTGWGRRRREAAVWVHGGVASCVERRRGAEDWRRWRGFDGGEARLDSG